MGSRITYPPFLNIGNNVDAQQSVVVSDSNILQHFVIDSLENYNKIEFEYSFGIPALGLKEHGRITLVYDGADVSFTSYEREAPLNQDLVYDVEAIAFKNGNDIGISIDNQTGKGFTFFYTIKDRIKVPL